MRACVRVCARGCVCACVRVRVALRNPLAPALKHDRLGRLAAEGGVAPRHSIFYRRACQTIIEHFSDGSAGVGRGGGIYRTCTSWRRARAHDGSEGAMGWVKEASYRLDPGLLLPHCTHTKKGAALARGGERRLRSQRKIRCSSPLAERPPPFPHPSKNKNKNMAALARGGE